VPLTCRWQSITHNVEDNGSKLLFWTGLAEGLHKERAKFPSPALVDESITKCLATAALQWDYVEPTRPAYSWNYSVHTAKDESATAKSKAKISRITKVVDVSLKANTLEPCAIILADVVKDAKPEGLPEKFRDLFVPLIISLHGLLPTYNLRLSSPPFGDAIRRIVKIYVDNFATQRPSFTGSGIVPKLGCSCRECKRVDAFMANDEETQYELRAAQATRSHVEQQLSRTRPILCTFETRRWGSPHTLVVKKTPGVIELAQRESRVKSRREFFGVIGKEELKVILGEPDYQQLVGQ
jgi:hypothetical protein